VPPPALAPADAVDQAAEQAHAAAPHFLHQGPAGMSHGMDAFVNSLWVEPPAAAIVRPAPVAAADQEALVEARQLVDLVLDEALNLHGEEPTVRQESGVWTPHLYTGPSTAPFESIGLNVPLAPEAPVEQVTALAPVVDPFALGDAANDLSRKHKCGECFKSFSSSGALARHAVLHKPCACLDIPRVACARHPFECTTCGKRDSQMANLQVHINVHLGKKTAPCDVCGKDFSNQSNLDKHRERTVACGGTKAFPCEVCELALNPTPST